MENLLETPIGKIVAEDYRTAQIFKNHKIDFCCQGNRSVREAAEKHKLDAHVLLNEISNLQNLKNEEKIDFQAWPLEELINYIVKRHHRYVEEQIPILKVYLEKLCRVHGEHHSELFEITDNFNKSGAELAGHMKKEELILFPIIKKMEQAKRSAKKFEKAGFGTVLNPIQKMMDEHETEGERFRQIERLSNGYITPADACNTYKVTYALLKEFEDDLHQHIHLENNILFPKAAELEKELAN